MTIDDLIEQILALPGVDDAIPQAQDGGVTLIDGRMLIPINIYLRENDQGETLGIHVKEVITTEDRFGG